MQRSRLPATRSLAEAPATAQCCSGGFGSGSLHLDLPSEISHPPRHPPFSPIRFHLRAPRVQGALHLLPGRDVLQEAAADIFLVTDRRAGLKNTSVGLQACMRAAEKRSALWHGCARPRADHAAGWSEGTLAPCHHVLRAGLAPHGLCDAPANAWSHVNCLALWPNG